MLSYKPHLISSLLTQAHVLSETRDRPSHQKIKLDKLSLLFNRNNKFVSMTDSLDVPFNLREDVNYAAVTLQRLTPACARRVEHAANTLA